MPRIASRPVLIHSASGHAIDRYRERCSKEHLTFQECRKQLLELARAGEWHEELPAWTAPPAGNVETAGFVVVADSFVLPVSPDGVVMTVLARGSSALEVVARRREGRRKRRGYLRAKGHGGAAPMSRAGGRPDPEWA